MRTEIIMYDLIIDIAKKDERVRAVFLNGSRANPRALKDKFQDFDIVYFVKEIKSFLQDSNWIDVFGERLIMQLPTDIIKYNDRFTYLMQFTDGNRIDLTLMELDCRDEYLKEDSITKLLLDKDEVFLNPKAPSDIDYWVKKPCQEDFDKCCNEFYWVSLYIAKGLARNEILYAMDHLDKYVRNEYLRMVSWIAGINTDFACSVGKSYKDLDRYIDGVTWKNIIQTYPHANKEELWGALLNILKFFKDASLIVSNTLGFTIDDIIGDNVCNYILQMKTN
jgi:aminoglycoside 6-adenylyltransferase